MCMHTRMVGLIVFAQMFCKRVALLKPGAVSPGLSRVVNGCAGCCDCFFLSDSRLVGGLVNLDCLGLERLPLPVSASAGPISVCSSVGACQRLVAAVLIGLRRNVFGRDVVSLARLMTLCGHAPPDLASSFRLSSGG